MNLDQLHSLIAALCPINGINSNGAIWFKPEATPEQQAAAQAIMVANLPKLGQIEPPTKEQQIAHTLATIGKGRDRSLIQTIITLAETVAIPKLAADNNVTYEYAKAAAYARNPTYKAAVDCEAACRAIETAP